MKALRAAARMLRVNWKPLLIFELIYKLSAAALFMPAFSLVFSLLMRLTGHRYLTAENITAFLLHPFVLAGTILILWVIGAYTLVDQKVVVSLLYQGADGRRGSALYAFRQALRGWKGALRPVFLPFSLYLLVLALFLHLGMIVGVMGVIRVPVILSNYLLKHLPLLAALVGLLLALGYGVLRWIYVMPIHLLEGLPFPTACRKSRLLSQTRFWGDFKHLLAAQAGLIVLFLLFSLGGILLLRLISSQLARAVLTGHVLALLIGILLSISILSVPALFSVILSLYRGHLRASGLPLPSAAAIPAVTDPRRRRLLRGLSLLAILAVLAGCALVLYRYQRGHYNLDIEYLRATEVTAHRGASLHAPENTMAAFEAAWDQGADWIELDVHQSSDGKVYCLHDGSFSRVTGVAKRSWELTWEEISRLDAGSRFSPAFAGEPLPLLEEAIDFAEQRGIRLNIELKPTAHDRGLEAAVADIILARGFESQCVVTCQQYTSLEKIKAYAPDLTTVYVMSVVYGNLAQLTAADHFSVAYSYITRDMVSRLHQAGKQIYAWTVDRADIMQRMIDLGVDNIITNNVSLGVATVSAAAASDIVQTLVEELVDAEELIPGEER